MRRTKVVCQILLVGLVLLLAAGRPGAVSAEPKVWTTHGPEGGSINTLVIDPATPTTIYAAASAAGVFKSTDGGGSWSAASAGLPSRYVSGLAIDPLAPATLYAAVQLNGVYKSTDGGGTWSDASTGLPAEPWMGSLAVDPLAPATLYVAIEEAGVFKSTDGGGNWSAANTGLPAAMVFVLVIDPLTPTTLYAATGLGVYKSINGGESWDAINAGLPEDVVFSLAIDPLTPATLYAGTSGLFKTTDGGESWSAANAGLPAAYVFALAIDPLTPATVYAGTETSGVFKSTDGGGIWSAANNGLAFTYVPAVAVDPLTPATVYAGTSGGVFKSTDGGGKWSGANTGLIATLVGEMVIDPATPDTLYAGTWNAGVFKSTDGGGTWSAASAGLHADVNAMAIDPLTPTTLYVGTWGLGVFRTTDGAGSWSDASSGLTDPFVQSLAVDPLTPGTVYAGTIGGGVFKSTDYGANWSPANAGLPEFTVYALVIHPQTPTTLYAGLSRAGVFQSTDSGDNWSELNAGLTNTDVWALAMDPLTPTTLYAGTWGGGVFKTTDGGANWSEINNGLPDLADLHVQALAVDPAGPLAGCPTKGGNNPGDAATSGTLYAGTQNGGVFRSTDGGASWSEFNDGLANTNAHALAIDPSLPATLYAGTYGGGVFDIALSNTATVHVRAYIDGRSQLVVRGDTVYWHHLDAAAPGRWLWADEPTYLNGAAWYPAWADLPDPENRDCHCDSSSYVGIPALAPQDQTTRLEVFQARNRVTIVQQPEAANDYTLIVDLDDGDSGADWYEIDVTYVCCANVYLTPPEQTNQGTPAQIVAHQETLRNETGATDTFNLALGSHVWDTALSTASVGPLADGDAATFTVYVTVPPGADWHATDTVAVTASSATSPGLYADSATLTTEAYAPAQISVSPEELASTQLADQVVSKVLTIRNANGVPLTFNLTGVAVGRAAVGDPVLLLPMDEPASATSFLDVSGKGNHGLCAGASCPTAGVAGRFGTALAFDGANDYVKIGSPVPSTLRLQNELSLEAWVYLTQYPDGISTIVGCQYDGKVSGYAIHVRGSSDGDPPGHIHFQIGNGDWHATDTHTQIPLNQWVHIVAVRKANEDAVIYYNGVPQPSTSAPWDGSITYFGAEFDLGRQFGFGDRFLNGALDQVAIYDRALSAEEVQTLYLYGPVATDAPWLSATPLSGTVPTNGSVPIQVTLDATGLQTGIYSAQIFVQSNDPLRPVVSVPVTLNIPLTGDLDGDCDVDVVDVMLVASRWNTQAGNPRYDARYDLDGDGDIDVVDIMRVAAHWFETCTAQATWQLLGSDQGAARWSGAMAFDLQRQVMVMFGGRTPDVPALNETWEFDGFGWHKVTPAHQPPSRFWHSMAYDAQRQRMVLFGGTNEVNLFGDTWEYDGNDWQIVATAHSPAPRSRAALAYDSCRRRVVLFGGWSEMGLPTDTWEYDGSDWTQVPTAAVPSGRDLIAMAFDSHRCKTVLFGSGVIFDPAPAGNDTWEYDGTNWTQVSTPAAPMGRWAHAMAYDASRRRVVLFGGYGPTFPSGTALGDTWEYDGHTWTRIVLATAPSRREQHVMAYDAARRRVVLFGGAWNYSTAGETWQYK